MTTEKTPPEDTLTLPRKVVSDMYKVCAELLGDTGYTPPPPGSTEKQLPDHILELIVRRYYLSTACETAEALERAIVRYRDHEAELMMWRDRMHAECRLNNKFTGVLCDCECHHRDDA